MERGNVLVIGNSGVGKSTLINAVLGEKCAEAGWGTRGTTDKLEIYENAEVPFRIIDTMGFEPTFIKERQAIHAVNKWSKESAKDGREDSQINAIWLCVEGTSSKLFPKTIKNMVKATRIWKSVPVIVVITKSYSVPERTKNIEMVNDVFSQFKHHSINLKKIIPVVAETYVINDTAFAPPEGITELIDITNELMPEGIKAGQKDLADYKLSRRRALSHGVVAASTASGAVIGAIPIPIADAAILSPLEAAEVNAIAKVYGIHRDENSKKLLNSIIEIGTVGMAAKLAISAVKAIPGINLAASIINAVIASSIIAALGEGSIYVFEQIYLGNKSITDIDWVRRIMESKLSSEFVDKINILMSQISDNMNKKEISRLIFQAFIAGEQKD